MQNPTNPVPSTRTVMVLDDQIFYRDILVRLLDMQTHLEVIGQADFSDQAMSMILNLEPDIILAAPCQNPETNLFFIEQLLSRRQDTCILLIASSCDTEDLVKFICSGVSGIFLKARNFEILLKAIDRVLAGELWFERTLLKSIVDTADKIPPAQPPANTIYNTNNKLDGLSRRELQIVELVVQGQNTNSIAKTLAISEKTVRNHIYSIYGKLEVSDRLELARFASQTN